MMDSDNDRPQVSRSEGDKQAGQLPDLESANAPAPTTPNVLARLGLENNAFPSEETEEQLRLALTDPAWYMRAAAVQILAKRGKRTSLEPLINALNDENGFVRATAALALGTLQEEVPVDRLVMALRDSEWRVRTAAALALGALGKRALVEPLAIALRDEDESVRVAAASALSMLQERASIEAVVVALGDSEWYARGTAKERLPMSLPSTFPIEAHYSSAGSWAITTGSYTDASGNTYDLFYPSQLGANGFKHPILTWGNGSFGMPSLYTGVLNQLVSWGFVIIASTSEWTGTGNEILAGAQDIVSLNNDPCSVFYNQLNTNAVGAIGHSQGAGGSDRATLHSGGLIKTVVPINLPAPIWVNQSDAFNLAQLTVPVLFLGGSNDWLIAPPWALLEYYIEVPGAAAMLVLNDADHLTIQGSGGRYLGYLTAWMMYQLQGDQYARGAFVGAPPEANSNTNWSWQAEKNLY